MVAQHYDFASNSDFLYIAICQNEPNVQGTYHCDHLVGEL